MAQIVSKAVAAGASPPLQTKLSGGWFTIGCGYQLIHIITGTTILITAYETGIVSVNGPSETPDI